MNFFNAKSHLENPHNIPPESSSEGDADEILDKAIRGLGINSNERAILNRHYPGILDGDNPTKH